MYRIAICDDEQAELDRVKELLNYYKKQRPCTDLIVCEFTSMTTLRMEAQARAVFDLLILDVYLPGQNGIDGARQLRESGYDGSILFITSSLEHSLDAFRVDAVQYLVKPVEEERFFDVLDKTFNRINWERQQYIALKAGRKIRRIPVRDIRYCEAQNHHVQMYFADGEVLTVRMPLTELKEQMKAFPEFAGVGSTYVVNLDFVDSLTAKSLVLTNGETIWLPRGAYAALREQYFAYYRRTGW